MSHNKEKTYVLGFMQSEERNPEIIGEGAEIRESVKDMTDIERKSPFLLKLFFRSKTNQWYKP